MFHAALPVAGRWTCSLVLGGARLVVGVAAPAGRVARSASEAPLDLAALMPTLADAGGADLVVRGGAMLDREEWAGEWKDRGGTEFPAAAGAPLDRWAWRRAYAGEVALHARGEAGAFREVALIVDEDGDAAGAREGFAFLAAPRPRPPAPCWSRSRATAPSATSPKCGGCAAARSSRAGSRSGAAT